ncbi:unnamed protein product, partial [Schistosoma mattheei]
RGKSQKSSLAKDSIQSKNHTNFIPNNHSTVFSSKLKETPVTSKSNDILDNRLNQLDDSTKELLSYYRHKVETLTEDHETVQRRLDKIYDAIGNQESLSLELNQRDAEISELQRALSDMQNLTCSVNHEICVFDNITGYNILQGKLSLKRLG